MLKEVKIHPFQCMGKKEVCKGEAERAALLTSQMAGPRLHITLFPTMKAKSPGSLCQHTLKPSHGGVGRLAPSPCPDPAVQMPPVPPRVLSQRLPALTKANADFLSSSQAKT